MLYPELPFQPQPQLAPGSAVAAKWSDGSYYLATITAVSQQGFHVLYEDGTQVILQGNDMIPVPRNPDLHLGDRVLACWTDSCMYVGVVTADKGVTFTVAWEEGGRPTDVVAGRIVRIPLSPQPQLAPGSAVAAKWSDGSYYLATVTAVSQQGFHILYEDGTQSILQGNDMIPVPRQPDLHPGDRVLACWTDSCMYPGVVTADKGVTFTVVWEGGGSPMDVVAGRIVRIPPAATWNV
jgi:hypothetical protein